VSEYIAAILSGVRSTSDIERGSGPAGQLRAWRSLFYAATTSG